MKLTCSQMDVLISFYIEDELSCSLRALVEQHLKDCATCMAKYDIIKSMLKQMQTSLKSDERKSQKESSNTPAERVSNTHQYRLFKTNLSAYLDNELSNEENLKIKKIAINNKKARKDLEDSYNIRKLMSESFRKAKNLSKKDYSKNIIKMLELEDEVSLGIHPAVKLIIGLMVAVFVLTTFVLISLNA